MPVARNKQFSIKMEKLFLFKKLFYNISLNIQKYVSCIIRKITKI